MADSALYFPYIEIPESPSLTRVLLYWDTLGSIVPDQIFRSPRMSELINTGLVVPIDPRDYTSAKEHSHRAREREFTQLIDQLPMSRPKRRRSGLRNSVRIHTDKGDWSFWSRLEEEGLATIPEDTRYGHRGWLFVDGEVGAAYMALLAIWIGREGSTQMDPVTDQKEYWEVLANNASLRASHDFDRMRAAMLRNVLPAPSRPISPGSLAEFKMDHAELLGRMRLHVEKELLQCAAEQDPALRARRLDLAARQLEEDAEEARRRMHERRWPSPRDAACAVLQGIPGLASGLVTGSAALSATGAVPIAIEVIRNRFGDPGLPEAPVAYAVIANKRFA